MDKSAVIRRNLSESIELKRKILSDEDMIGTVSEISEKIIETYRKSGKVLFCGNGGSAADAQHLAAELSGRYYYDRPPLNAEALHVNTSYLTAVANDYSYDEVYKRLVIALGKEGDTLIGISTSGNSKNVINALEQAKKLNMVTIGFSGNYGGEMKKYCDILVEIPSNDTPRIQESYMILGHSICDLVEQNIFPK